MSGDIGKVHLVGAGPGDSELLTVKAKRLIENSDVILHDSLVGDGVLDWIPESAEVHNVGKKPGGERTPPMPGDLVPPRHHPGSPVSSASAMIAEQSTPLELALRRSMNFLQANQLNPA